MSPWCYAAAWVIGGALGAKVALNWHLGRQRPKLSKEESDRYNDAINREVARRRQSLGKCPECGSIDVVKNVHMPGALTRPSHCTYCDNTW